ncbi:ATPase AAA [Anopheles sinensis]|uniref:ATPase AAA n=1 Tax=Anopheles sinensis TaxID=74873 RepID=A0A084W8W1_ANOSI|nr:ATPase AAA [Anopheles sinensis]
MQLQSFPPTRIRSPAPGLLRLESKPSIDQPRFIGAGYWRTRPPRLKGGFSISSLTRESQVNFRPDLWPVQPIPSIALSRGADGSRF